MLNRGTLVIAIAWMILASAASNATADTPAPAPADRMAWFQDARFGMFIHWGIYSVPAGEWNGKKNYSEWIQLQTQMPAEEYAKFTTQFNPEKFDAKAWVKIAKDAGMKYIVVTAKHHDGFCMFDTKLTDYNIVQATPYHSDPMKDLADACRDAGVKLCFYYSIPDWHHPDFPAKYSQRGFHGQPNPDADLDKYIQYVKGQVRELLTNYGPIGVMWFDDGGSFRAEGDKRAELIHAQEIIDLVHELQPDCLVNNRLGLPGDYGTPEHKIPGSKPDAPFEVCMTLNRHWGYNKADHNWKKPKEVIQDLADVACKGGNYLLNVGPTSDGEIPEEAAGILADVGQWMSHNAESIYGTTASPLDSPPSWGRLTQKGSKVYLHVFDWPSDGKLPISGLKEKPTKAYLLGSPDQNLPVETDGDAVTLSLPPQAPDAIDSVVVIETE